MTLIRNYNHMKGQSLLNKIFAFFAVLSGSIWLGAYAERMIISYQLFDIDLNVMPYVNQQNLSGILVTITPSVYITFILYIFFIFSFTIFLFSSKIGLRENGWLFIIAVIIYLTLPFEAYLLTIDYKIISALNYSDVIDAKYVISLFKDRFTDLSSFPIIIFLSYWSLIYFLFFKPFTNKIQNETS
jgi:hypothetical protein